MLRKAVCCSHGLPARLRVPADTSGVGLGPLAVLQDEPTSGLDASTSMHVLSTLRHLAGGHIMRSARRPLLARARLPLTKCLIAACPCGLPACPPAGGGRSIIATLHQPSFRLYEQLDKLMLLSQVGAAGAAQLWPDAGQSHPRLPRRWGQASHTRPSISGKSKYSMVPQHAPPACPPLRPPCPPQLCPQGHLLYYGSAAAAADWFSSHGYTLPYRVSLPDFLLDLANGDVATHARCAHAPPTVCTCLCPAGQAWPRPMSAVTTCGQPGPACLAAHPAAPWPDRASPQAGERLWLQEEACQPAASWQCVRPGDAAPRPAPLPFRSGMASRPVCS